MNAHVNLDELRRQQERWKAARARLEGRPQTVERRATRPAPAPQQITVVVQSVMFTPEPLPKPLSGQTLEGVYGKAIARFALSPSFALPHEAVTVGEVMRAVSRAYQFSKGDLMSARRTGQLVIARHHAFFLIRVLTARSLPEIGRRFGKDHTTVLHGIAKHAQRLEQCSPLLCRVERFDEMAAEFLAEAGGAEALGMVL